jgi:tetratricopeptide (TPR) repeat protein
MIKIELSHPAKVKGEPARQQSLWFLLRLWLAAQSNEGSTWVRETQLRERFSAARNLRMMISRAFSDFTRWGVRVGWGTDANRQPDMLPLAGRNRGPYWLAHGEAARIKILLHGKKATTLDVADWLGMATDIKIQAFEIEKSSNASVAYWHAWADARRDMLSGRLIVDGEHGALAGYRRAHSLAPDAWLQALALLQQAMVWRRAGNADAARSVLAELDRYWQDVETPEHAWLGAMAAIVQAWCAYASRDVQVARYILKAAADDPRWSGVFQYHPRVRSENANLQALLHRAIALNDSHTMHDRTIAAQQSLQHYQLALALANEAELFDAAASAASNLGWSIWLFSRCGLKLETQNHSSALHWIALATWLGERQGIGSSAWNTIYLLRMVRDGGPLATHPSEAIFQTWPVLSPLEFRKQTAPIILKNKWKSWLELATALEDEIDTGRLQVDALQRVNLLLEIAWYEAREGKPTRFSNASKKLKQRLREINPADRIFFRKALQQLPKTAI